MSYVVRISLTAAIGGFLFGYDTAVIAGAIGFLQQKFQLTTTLVGWAVSCALLGCMGGSLIAGPLGDQYGRKKALVVAAILFFVSALGSAFANSLTIFCIARIVGGLGVGMASILAPMYIAEISPADKRGKLVTLNQLGIVVGILVVYFVNALIAGLVNDLWNIEYGWRWMFGSEAMPALAFLVGLYFAPESPRWLVKNKHYDKASKTLHRIYTRTETVLAELSSIKNSLSEKKHSSWSEIVERPHSRALSIGVCLAVLSQITGINAIMYYAPEIFKQSGSSTSSALYQTVAIGLINLVFTFVAIKHVDKVGRRRLLLVGASLMAASLGLVAFCFSATELNSYFVLSFILLFIASFAMSFGPVTWVVIAEIFPNHIRAKAMSASILSLWVGVFVVSQGFPIMLESLGASSTFYFFMAMSCIAFIFVYKYVPETKEKSLEEIELFWLQNFNGTKVQTTKPQKVMNRNESL